MTLSATDNYVHLPTPGDHYSPATGSAIMSIIYELTKAHAETGGSTKIIVSAGTRHDYTEGLCVEVAARQLLTRAEKIQDLFFGLLNKERRFSAQLYGPASNAIPPDFEGTIFLWNAPGCISAIRRDHPKARLCLYAQNWLFKTYSTWELSALVNQVDKVVCCSEFIADQVRSLLNRPSNKIFGLVNGVDTEVFCPPQSRTSETIPTVLFVGRVQPFKGSHLLIEAAKKIHSSKRQFKVRIVGSSGFASDAKLSPYEQKLRELAHPIAQIVEFKSFVDRKTILNEYHNAAISCVPSIWNEPCSLTVPESMACGLPTIASSRGGIPEVAGDGALLFDPKNLNELAEKLVYLIDDPNALDTWSANARRRAEQIDWHLQYRKLRVILDS